MNLLDVVKNMQQVADAAGISKRGEKLCDELRSNLNELKSIVEEKRTNRTKKRMLLMEWVDPPYCGGHWIRKKEIAESGTLANYVYGNMYHCVSNDE